MCAAPVLDGGQEPDRISPSPMLLTSRVIAVLRALDATNYDAVVDVLAESGVQSIELTLSTPGTLNHIESLVARVGHQAEIGVGTITTTDDARHAIEAGAKYLVTPTVDREIVAVAIAHGLPVFSGGLTPTELLLGWHAGASAVKIFPAETVGVQYALHLKGPFPDMQFIPSGGVTLESIPLWLEAGAVAVSLGGPLLGDALRGGSLKALAGRAERALTLAEESPR